MGQDLREAVRSLARTPLLSALVVLSLGLGIGMNTAVFSVVSAVLLKPMDYTDPERLVQIRGRFASDGVEDALLPGAVLSAVRRGTSQLQDVAGVAAIRQNLTGPEIPVQVQVGWVSTNFFRMLGVAPALGRGFADDEPPGRLLLSDAFWRRHFAADPGVAGRGVALDGRPYEIVGVMPAGFRLELPRLPGEIDVWKVPDDWWQNGKVWESTDLGAGILRLVGRLAPGATPQSARAELEAVSARLREGRPELARSGFALAVDPLHDAVVSRVRTTLWLLLGAAGSVLLIACANVANLQLVRGRRRAREIAVRLALGASRRRVVRLLLAEALLLAFLGGAMGVVLGSAGLDLLLHLRPSDLPRADAIRLDAAVLAFAAASCLGATLLFGLLPALAATRRDVAVDLHGARSPLGPDRRWAGASLVAAQVGLSLVLLLGGGVLAFSLHRLHAVPLGLDTDRLLTFSVSLPGTRYDRPLGTDAFLTRLEGSLRALPGVRAAGASWPLPLSGPRWSNVYEAGTVGFGQRAYADYRLATPALFETLRIPVLEGRTFSASDPRHSVVVSRRLAERAFPRQGALGRTVQANPWGGRMVAFRIVGVVGDVRSRSRRDPPVETLYFDSRGWSWSDWEIDVVVRAEGEPQRLVEAIRREIARIDPLVPMARPRTMEELVARDLAAHRFTLTLLATFALVAFVLATVGLFGIVSWAVSQRTREIGIRLALGAPPERVVAGVLGRGLLVAGLGTAAGLVASTAANRVLAGLLYEVAPTEGRIVVSVVAFVLGATALAAYVPARRAAAVDPVTTLRSE
jgi:putative ABC transport system permease protein